MKPSKKKVIKKAPHFTTREAHTEIRIKSGQTIAIGGLIKEEKITSHKKVPFLGDIPVMGFAFRSQDDEVSKTEIVIFLTPTIITGDVKKEDLAEAASSRQQ